MAVRIFLAVGDECPVRTLGRVLIRAGVVLIALSCLCWAGIPLLLLLGGLSGAVWAGVLAVVAEVLFWGGLVLAGRDTWKLAKTHGWRGVPRALWRAFRAGEVPVDTPSR